MRTPSQMRDMVGDGFSACAAAQRRARDKYTARFAVIPRLAVVPGEAQPHHLTAAPHQDWKEQRGHRRDHRQGRISSSTSGIERLPVVLSTKYIPLGKGVMKCLRTVAVSLACPSLRDRLVRGVEELADHVVDRVSLPAKR